MKMPHVTHHDQFSAFMSYVKDEAPRAHEKLWNVIKREMELSHFNHCFGDEATREQAAGYLLEYVEAKLEYYAGEEVALSVADRMRCMIAHQEVLQASDMEPHGEAAVWDMWDRMDAQSAFQDKIDMYRNEY